MSNWKKNIYVLRTHFINQSVMRLYHQLKNDFGCDNVVVLLDITKIPDLTIVPNEITHLITITTEEASLIDPLLHKFNLPGMAYRAEAVLTHLYDKITKHICTFQYMWLIEYDFYCRGSFAKALAPCDNIDCDFIAKGRDDDFEVRKWWKCPQWCWWNDLFGELESLPHMLRKGCLFAITRYSPRLLETVKANLGRSTGFCEVYIPCLCVANGLSYKALPFESIGDVRYRPTFSKEELEETAKPDKLYHPIKWQEYE